MDKAMFSRNKLQYFILHLVDKKFFPLQCRQRTQSRLECTFAVEDLETSGFAVRSHTQPPDIDLRE